MTRFPGPIIPDIATSDWMAAAHGDLEALDTVLRSVEPGVRAFALRMLGNPDDADDATQEVLVRIATHLGGFRGDARFSTWVFRIARNVLLTHRTRAREFPVGRFDQIAERLDAGVARGGTVSLDAQALSAEDRAEAADLARRCLQGMLLALGREQRLVIVLDTVFGLAADEAADVLGVQAPAYRKRLSRARRRLRDFLGAQCGLESPTARCRCHRQLPALRHEHGPGTGARPALPQLDVDVTYDEMLEFFDALAVLRAQARLAPNLTLSSRIREVLRAGGWLPA